MAAEEATPAIVLRTRDYMESDRIVTLLTEQAGKLGGIAKGAKASRRRFEHRLEPFSHVMLYFRRRPHGQLVFITRAEAAGLQPFRLEDDLGRLALGTYMLDLAEALTSEDAEASGAYHLLAEALGALGAGEANVALRQAYELRMFRWAGFGMQFDRCRVCTENQAEASRGLFHYRARRNRLRAMSRECARGRHPVERRQHGGAGRTGTDAARGCIGGDSGWGRRSARDRALHRVGSRSQAPIG